jgi:hypothetical protein
MMGVRYFIKAKGGEYEKDGQTKTKWIDIGVVLETQKGFMMKLDCIPTGWDGVAFLADPEKKPQGSSRGQYGPRGGRPVPPVEDDDIPF